MICPHYSFRETYKRRSGAALINDAETRSITSPGNLKNTRDVLSELYSKRTDFELITTDPQSAFDAAVHLFIYLFIMRSWSLSATRTVLITRMHL